MYCATVSLLHVITGLLFIIIVIDMPLVLGSYFNSSYFIYLLNVVSVRSQQLKNYKLDEKKEDGIKRGNKVKWNVIWTLLANSIY